jgi:hypothetical protein
MMSGENGWLDGVGRRGQCVRALGERLCYTCATLVLHLCCTCAALVTCHRSSGCFSWPRFHDGEPSSIHEFVCEKEPRWSRTHNVLRSTVPRSTRS